MENNRVSPEDKVNEGNMPLETDSEKIVRRHLEDEDDQITDADIRNVRIVGGEELTATDDETSLTDEEQDITRTDKDNELPDPNDKPITPWDVVS
jgi:hypothetical protein